jgi:large subunit ribosomal protein L29
MNYTKIKKISEYREKTVAELISILHEKLRFQFKLKLIKSQEDYKSHFLQQVRKDIARIKTLMVEKMGDK